MAPGSRDAADGFWAYSLRVYAQPGVSAACLRLQDGAGLDVNLLLLALYAGRGGLDIGIEDWQRLDARVTPLREHLIQPLRHARRWLKQQPPIPLQPALGDTSELRPALAELELQAERQVQALLEQALLSCAGSGAGTGAVAAAAANLSRYLQSRGVESATAWRPELATLMRAAEHEAQ